MTRPWILLPALAGLNFTATAEQPARLEEVVVTATLREMPAEELPASVSVLGRRVLDGFLLEDPRYHRVLRAYFDNIATAFAR